MRKYLATILVAASITLAVAPANATVFSAWKVSDVPFGDTLNVRKYPANYSQKQSAYPNGKVLQMTGKCTGGVNLHNIANMPRWKQRQIVRNQWCQLWHDPAGNGNYVAGWVYGKFIRPN